MANDPWRAATLAAAASLAAAKRQANEAPPERWDHPQTVTIPAPEPIAGEAQESAPSSPGDFPPMSGPPTSEEAARSRTSMHLEKVGNAAAEREAQREVVRRGEGDQASKNAKIADLNRADLADLAKAERIMEVVAGATTPGGKATANLTTIIAERSGDLDEALEQVEKLKGTTMLDEFPVSLPLLRDNLRAIFPGKSGMFKRPPKLSPRLKAVQAAQLEGSN